MADPDESTQTGVAHAVRNGFRRTHRHLHRNPITGFVTKVVVTILGVAVIGAGLVMMVTPGPGIVGILVGLGLLSTEYHWAERWMHAVKSRAQAAADHARDLDPAVRRRRLVLTVLGVVVLVGGVWGYVATFGWPGWAVAAWDWVQGLHDVIPELPGM